MGSYSFPRLAVMSVQEVVWSRTMRTDWAKRTAIQDMWFLTVDPLVRISVFIAKLSER